MVDILKSIIGTNLQYLYFQNLSHCFLKSSNIELLYKE